MNVQCCFCAAAIDKPDREGVRLTLAAMGNEAAQTLFVHVVCLEVRFAPIMATETVFGARAFEAG